MFRPEKKAVTDLISTFDIVILTKYSEARHFEKD
jgi:hypothetical protein